MSAFAEVIARLAKPIPEKFILQKPDKSRADYVPHHIIRQYLHAAFDDHIFETLQVEPKGAGGDSYAVYVRLQVFLGSEVRAYYGWGESENKKAPLKSAESDAVKRIAAMHLGLGLHLWSREHYFLPKALSGKVEEAAAEAAQRDARYGGDGDEAEAAPAPEEPAKAKPDAPADVPIKELDLEEMKLADLRPIADHLGVSRSGNKKALIARINAALDEDEADQAAEEAERLLKDELGATPIEDDANEALPRTPEQNKKLQVLRGELEVPDGAWRKRLMDLYEVESSADLTQAQASDLIERLEAARTQKGAA